MLAQSKAVRVAKNLLAGSAMNGASLKEKLDKTTYDALTSAFRSALTPEQKGAYAKLKTDQERRDQLAAFVLDPARSSRQEARTRPPSAMRGSIRSRGSG